MHKLNTHTITTFINLQLLFIFIFTTGSCDLSSRQKVRQSLKQAENLMWTKPDSSLHILQTISDIPQKGKTQAHYALLLTQATYRNNFQPTSDSLIRIAYDYYEYSADSLRKAWSNYYLATFYSDKGSIDKAIQHFQIAENAGKNVGDSHFFALLYDNWGWVLQKITPCDKALNLGLKAKRYYEATNDSIGLIINYCNIGWAYFLLHNEERSYTYLNNSADLALLCNRTDLLSQTYSSLAFVNEAYKHYDQALKYINLAIKYNEETDSTVIKRFYATKSYIFKGVEQYDSAKFYIAKTDTDSFNGKAIFHKEISEMDKAEGNYIAALYHQELYANNLDSFYNHQRDEKIYELQLNYEYENILYENEKIKAKGQTWGIIVLFIVITVLVIIIVLYYRHNKKENKWNDYLQSKKEVINNYTIKLQHISNEMLIQQQILQEKENALRMSIHKQKELEQKLQESTQGDSLKQQEQLITLEKEITELKQKIFHTNEVVKKIEKLKKLNALQKRDKKADLILSEEECNNLYEAVNHAYNNFEKYLRRNYASLTEIDIYICCLLRMGVSNIDICYLTDSSEAALKKRKYRIKREKMKNKEEGLSLEELLSRI